jgi:hypothetical protein
MVALCPPVSAFCSLLSAPCSLRAPKRLNFLATTLKPTACNLVRMRLRQSCAAVDVNQKPAYNVNVVVVPNVSVLPRNWLSQIGSTHARDLPYHAAALSREASPC